MPDESLLPNPDHYLVSGNGRLGAPPRSAVSQVGAILDKAISEMPPNGLVIHFHGGLVSRDYALKNITAPLTAKYQEANAYPLFFVWESGFKETIVNNKDDLLKDPAFRELVKKVSEWVLKKVSFSGIVSFKGTGGQSIEDLDAFRREYDEWFKDNRELPPVENTDITVDLASAVQAKASVTDLADLASQIETALDDDPGFKRAMAKAYNAANPPGEDVSTKGSGVTTERADTLKLSAKALDEMFPPEDAAADPQEKVKTRGIFTWTKVALFVAKIVIAVVKRFRGSHDHGVYCTVIEEVLRSAYGDLIGAVIWNQMKKDTADSFLDATDTCGLAVVKKLKELEVAGQSFKKLTLVGHSTGAIYICNFLDMAEKVGLSGPIQVVFLAPAVTCQRFALAVDAHGAQGLSNFRMFAMRDSRETEDQMLKPLYTRSLLYFVSGLLEGNPVGDGWNSILDMPLVGMERFYTNAVFSDDANVKKVLAFLEAKPHRIVWSKSEGEGLGLNSDSRHHGDFDNDESTLKSLVELIGS